MPLNTGGEIATPRAITRHLLWGSLFVLIGYLILSAIGTMFARSEAYWEEMNA